MITLRHHVLDHINGMPLAVIGYKRLSNVGNMIALTTITLSVLYNLIIKLLSIFLL